MSLTAFASTLALASLALTATAQEGCRDPYANQTIQWVACPVTGQETLECATLEVPLDYTDLSLGSLTLPIVRVPALGSSPKGSIFTNPGGPGGSGIEDIVNGGSVTQNTTGTDFHIVSFDPRGVGLTTPYVCPTLESAPGSELPLDDPTGLNATYVTNVNQGIYCNQSEYRQAGTLVGTAFVARDLMSVVNALGEDGMIRYWGSSYGTLLGATIAAMFPDKIDRMVLDGNINPTDYYHGLNEESVDNVDAALENFFVACASAGSEYCALADGTKSGEELQQDYLNFLAGYKNGSYALTDSEGTTYSYNNIKGDMYGNLKYPTQWNTLANNTASYYLAVQNPGGVVKRQEAAFNPLDASSSSGEYQLLSAVTCGDWDDIPGNGTLDDFADWLKLYEDRSSFGGDQLISILYACATWKVNAVEKYTGSFEGIDTSNPILFINGHLDPVTPLVSAQNSSHGFTGSGVLETNIPGHCSTAMVSSCVNDKIRSYFDTGDLPDLEERCDPDVAPFLPQDAELRNITDGEDINSTISVGRRWLHDPNFEYPAALRHVKRDVYEMLLERRQSADAPNCTALATATPPTATGSADSSNNNNENSASGRQIGASGVLAVLAAVGAAITFL